MIQLQHRQLHLPNHPSLTQVVLHRLLDLQVLLQLPLLLRHHQHLLLLQRPQHHLQMVAFYNIGTAPPPPAAPDATVPPAHDFSTLDFAKMAETMMALVPLNEDQKKGLLLSLRFKFISHEKLMKEAKNPLLEKFRDILMEGLSAKLDRKSVV